MLLTSDVIFDQLRPALLLTLGWKVDWCNTYSEVTTNGALGISASVAGLSQRLQQEAR